MFLQLLAEIGGIGHEHACDGTGVVQANDLHDNKWHLVSDLKISSD